MGASKKGGIIQIKADGEIFDAKGDYEYNFGSPVRTEIKGSDGRIHGYTEEAGVPFISGKITDHPGLDVKRLQQMEDVTVTCELANGKMGVWSEAFYAEEGTINTKEGEVPFRFIGKRGEEI